MAYKGKLKSCSAFVLDQPNTGMWLDIIESLALSTHINKASVLGYSGSRPKGFPPLSWYVDGDLPSMGEWLTENDSLDQVCFLDGINYDRILNYYPERIDFSLSRGFTGLEGSDKNYWAWSVWQTSSVFLHSFSPVDQKIKVNFTLEIPECLPNAEFNIKTDAGETRVSMNEGTTQTVEFSLLAKAWERSLVEITKDEGSCRVGDDPRDLHFSVKNLKISTY